MSNRERILSVIAAEGGMKKSQICEELDLSWGVVGHHLGSLSRSGELLLQYWGRELWAFHPSVQERDALRLFALAKPARRRLLRFLGNHSEATVQELSRELEACQQTIRSHLSHLMHAGIVSRTPGKPHKYGVLSEGGGEEAPA
ncbi:MAG: ArsR family transcriptional regulator [Thermoplasmatota archaeon]